MNVGKTPRKREAKQAPSMSAASDYVSITRTRLEELEASARLVGLLEQANAELSGALTASRGSEQRFQAAMIRERTRADDAEQTVLALRRGAPTAVRERLAVPGLLSSGEANGS